MPQTVKRERFVTIIDIVKVPTGTAESIFRDAHALLRLGVGSNLVLPDESGIQARIDNAANHSSNGLRHQWNFAEVHKPWHHLRAEIHAHVEPLAKADAALPVEKQNCNGELFRWQTALMAIDAILSNDKTLVQNETLLNQARAYWSMHDKVPEPRGKRVSQTKFLQRQNKRLRRELGMKRKQR